MTSEMKKVGIDFPLGIGGPCLGLTLCERSAGLQGKDWIIHYAVAIAL